MPHVSVIVPAFNVEAYIEQSIQSVLAQTYTDFELIVLDDGSTDRTVEIAARFTDPRVRIVSQANRGLAGARNGGIQAARGKLLAFLDADDLWRADKLEQHVRHLAANPSVGVSYSQSSFIDDAGQPMNYGQYPKLNDVTARDVFLRNPIGNGSAPVIRAAVMREIAFSVAHRRPGEIQYFDETFRRSEDIECWLRIVLCTDWQIEGIAAPLTLYRVNAGGLSANLEAQLESWEGVVRNVASYAPEFAMNFAGQARGYQLRYLARRAVRSGLPAKGLNLLRRALASHPHMLREEPSRTAATAVAALLGLLLPQRAYQQLEAWGMALANRMRARPVQTGTLAAPARSA